MLVLDLTYSFQKFQETRELVWYFREAILEDGIYTVGNEYFTYKEGNTICGITYENDDEMVLFEDRYETDFMQKYGKAIL